MANVNNPTGFKPVRLLAGAAYNGQAELFAIPAGDPTATFIGDLVKLAGTGETVNGVNYQDVIQASTGDKLTGVVVGFLPDTRDSLTYRAASTLRLVWVATDPTLLYEVQEDTGGTTLVLNDIGLNVNFEKTTAGSTTTGYSGMQLDTSTQQTTNTLDLKIVQFVNRPDNAIGANAKWLVLINRSQFANQVAGV